MRYVRGKGSRAERRVRASASDRSPSLSNKRHPRTVFRRARPDGGVCTAFRFRKPSLPAPLPRPPHLLSPLSPPPPPVTAFGRAALHLSNQRPRKGGEGGGRVELLSIREIAQLLQFRFAYIRIRGVFDRHRQLNPTDTSPETRSSYYLNIPCDTHCKFSIPFLASCFSPFFLFLLVVSMSR